MHYKRLITMMLLVLLGVWRAAAYDFAATAPTGQTLYYAFVDGGVAVVHPNNSPSPASGWNNFTRPEGALTIPANAEYNGLSYNVVMVDANAFFGCDLITSVTVLEGVEALGLSAFRLCSSLTSISLPSTLDTIDRYAFYGCTSLQSVSIQRATPPRCAGDAFFELPLADLELTVPYGCTEAYSGVAPWNSFGTIVEAMTDVTVTATANYEQRGTVEGGGVYPIASSVTLTAVPADGYFFACWQDGDTVNPRTVMATQEAHYMAYFFAYRYNTVTVYDTVPMPQEMHTLTVTSSDAWRGIVAGNATVPQGTLIEIAAIPLGDNTFTAWSDGNSDNPRRVSVDSDITLTATFSPNNGMATTSKDEWSVTADNQRITVSCGVGETVRLFDLEGRCLLTLTATAATTRIDPPAKGVYLVSVGISPAKRIICK